MGALRNIVGQKFGRLKVIERANPDGSKKVKWLCICECGNSSIAQSAHLLDGRRVSCGCAHKPGNQVNPMSPRSHGHCTSGKSSKIYRIWSGMFTRCTNKNSPAYQYYGARGIKVCDRWKDFKLFLEDMGDPDPGQSLDRIDVNGNYEPNNCRWATATEQARNKRSNMLLTMNNVTMTLVEWSIKYGINESTLWSRLIKSGWGIDRAISEKIWTKSDIAKHCNKVRWSNRGI